MKKVLFVIAFRDFQDQEYLVPEDIIEDSGIKTETVSNKKGLAVGVFGETIKINKTISDIEVDNYEAVVFIGGGGCLPHLDNEKSYKIIKDFHKKNKIIAGICIASVILAKAGILKGKRATVWNSPMDQHPVRTLEKNGAIYKASSVIRDGNIVTARGPEVANEFGKEMVKALNS